VSFPFAQALFRLLGLAAGSEDLSFNERTYLDPATFEAARFQLASHFFDGLLGPFAWAESDLDAPGLMTVDPLADTRLLDATRVDLFLELCAHLGLTLVGVVVLAAVINQVNRLRCNDGDFIERKQVTFRTSFCTMVWLEFMYFGYRFLGQPWDCLARCCCPSRKTRRGPSVALAMVLRSSAMAEMARTFDRCPGPMQASREVAEEEALHFACKNANDLQECFEIFGASAKRAGQLTQLMQTAFPIFAFGRHAEKGGFLAGVLAEPYCPPAGLVVGAEVKAMTYASQRTSRQLRKVRLDQYELRDFCVRMAEQYNLMEDTQTKISAQITDHMKQVARGDNVEKFLSLLSKK
jgi:hypothetical protein